MTTSTVPSRALAPDVDPVRFEVIRNALLAITEEMGATLRRAAYSTNIKTRGDFSCAFFDRDLRTIAQAFAQPSHLGSLAHIVPRAITAYGADHLAPGDGILINDPYLGGVHLNDITLITPSSTRERSSATWRTSRTTSTWGAAPRGASGCRARSTRRGWSSRRCGS
jgi:N-methylhydantoinase B/oxoprolinase/acetone carboxylase alpha subunit